MKENFKHILKNQFGRTELKFWEFKWEVENACLMEVKQAALAGQNLLAGNGGAEQILELPFFFHYTYN